VKDITDEELMGLTVGGVPRELFVGNYFGIGGEVGLCY
jgi:hypothetical protein